MARKCQFAAELFHVLRQSIYPNETWPEIPVGWVELVGTGDPSTCGNYYHCDRRQTLREASLIRTHSLLELAKEKTRILVISGVFSQKFNRSCKLLKIINWRERVSNIRCSYWFISWNCCQISHVPLSLLILAVQFERLQRNVVRDVHFGLSVMLEMCIYGRVWRLWKPEKSAIVVK